MVKKKRNLILGLAILLFVVASACGIYLYKEHKAIQDAVEVVVSVQQKVVIESDNSVKDIDPNLLRKIDFGELKSINSDVKTWVYVPDTNIDYYVMQEPVVGETYYLWKDIYKNNSSWGSVLTPKQPDENVEDAHLLLFGHHMKDKTVAFGNLKKYADVEYGETHKNVYMYYPDHSERWNVWAVCHSDANDMIYEIPYELGSDDYQTLLDSIDSKKVYAMCDMPDNNTETLVLSTCNGRYQGSPIRFYIVCVPDEVHYYE